jgi:REP element-mobilizing transposase RayT
MPVLRIIDLIVGEKQAVSASPGSGCVHGNDAGNTDKGEAGESFASPLQEKIGMKSNCHRHSLRLRDYDYRGAGAYFVTICSYQKECLFGGVVEGEVRLNEAGLSVVRCWQKIPVYFQHVELDEYVVMPNHFHAILHIIETSVGAKQGVSASPGFDGVCCKHAGDVDKGEAGESFASPLQPQGTQGGSFGAIVQNFKSVSTRKINRLRDNAGCPVWQRNYYDRVIRSEKELANIRQYIADNPAKWGLDENNPVNAVKFP